MSAPVKSFVIILLLINLLLLLPAVYGIILLWPVMLHDAGAIVLVISLLAGIANGIHLYLKRHVKWSWYFNLGMSVYALVFWTIVVYQKSANEFNALYLLVFIWPLAMTGTSLFVIAQYSAYRRSKQVVF